MEILKLKLSNYIYKTLKPKKTVMIVKTLLINLANISKNIALTQNYHLNKIITRQLNIIKH